MMRPDGNPPNSYSLPHKKTILIVDSYLLTGDKSALNRLEKTLIKLFSPYTPVLNFDPPSASTPL